MTKRLLATLIAGVMLVTAAIGAGTWAWFTNQTTIEQAEFWTATVEGNVANDGKWEVFNFTVDGRGAQVAIANTVAAASDHWNSWTDDPDWDAEGTHLSNEARNAMFNAIHDRNTALKPADTDNGLPLVSPGSMLIGTFTITNDGNIPVDFRVQNPGKEGQATLWPAGANDHAFWGVDVREYPGSIIIEEDGFWYGAAPILPGESVELTMVAYVRSDQPAEIIDQDEAFFLAAMQVQFLQATNNAAYLGGWSLFDE